MRRRYVLALVLATALIFLTIGYYVRTLRDEQGPTAVCIRFRHLLNSETGLSNEAVAYYDEYCR